MSDLEKKIEPFTTQNGKTILEIRQKTLKDTIELLNQPRKKA